MERFCLLTTMMLAAAGCGSATCDDLAEECELCPDTPDGRQARTSCLGVVEADDSVVCEQQLDAETFARHGCQ
jgi:hypothetical protein